MYSKGIHTEALFTYREINNESNVNYFFKIVPLAFNTIIPASFSLFEALLKFLV